MTIKPQTKIKAIDYKLYQLVYTLGIELCPLAKATLDYFNRDELPGDIAYYQRASWFCLYLRSMQGVKQGQLESLDLELCLTMFDYLYLLSKLEPAQTRQKSSFAEVEAEQPPQVDSNAKTEVNDLPQTRASPRARQMYPYFLENAYENNTQSKLGNLGNRDQLNEQGELSEQGENSKLSKQTPISQSQQRTSLLPLDEQEFYLDLLFFDYKSHEPASQVFEFMPQFNYLNPQGKTYLKRLALSAMSLVSKENFATNDTKSILKNIYKFLLRFHHLGVSVGLTLASLDYFLGNNSQNEAIDCFCNLGDNNLYQVSLTWLQQVDEQGYSLTPLNDIAWQFCQSELSAKEFIKLKNIRANFLIRHYQAYLANHLLSP
ncbi:hypothetical protein CKF54_05950 [Psittacicella hinzii]|uniref:Uncharacterized protein n=1 Tax=Psittacicella hinzii TaxID=2028575 RepID=A0A3A1Y6U3_9GAMM|nr:hypothetical protein [Psittacicella hinzii]RIY31837.1 hypothetical protein CKF54_05950 [Psittacicella hinzii]